MQLNSDIYTSKLVLQTTFELDAKITVGPFWKYVLPLTLV